MKTENKVMSVMLLLKEKNHAFQIMTLKKYHHQNSFKLNKSTPNISLTFYKLPAKINTKIFLHLHFSSTYSAQSKVS